LECAGLLRSVRARHVHRGRRLARRSNDGGVISRTRTFRGNDRGNGVWELLRSKGSILRVGDGLWLLLLIEMWLLVWMLELLVVLVRKGRREHIWVVYGEHRGISEGIAVGVAISQRFVGWPLVHSRVFIFQWYGTGGWKLWVSAGQWGWRVSRWTGGGPCEAKGGRLAGKGRVDEPNALLARQKQMSGGRKGGIWMQDCLCWRG
jgi:hypothetical protein